MSIYGYRIADAVNVTSGTGTLSSSGVNITGTGTNFDPELVEGSIIHADGYDLVIATVTDDTHCTVVTAPAVALSGATFTITGMSNVEALNIKPPKSAFRPWQTALTLGDGTQRGYGRPSASWAWGFVTQAQRNSLRNYCSGKSARVYIRTRKNDSSDAYVTYSAVLDWPDEEDRQAGRRLSFRLEFRDLVAL